MSQVLHTLLQSLCPAPATPSSLSPPQTTTFTNLLEKNLFLFNPSTLTTLHSKSPEAVITTKQLLLQIQTHFQQTRRQLLSIDLPIYYKIIENSVRNQVVEIDSQELSRQIGEIEGELNSVLLRVVRNRVTPCCSVRELELFVSYLEGRVERGEDILIEEIGEWRYHEEYSRGINNTNDLLNLIGVMRLQYFQRQILTAKISCLTIVNTTQKEQPSKDQQFKTLPTQGSIQENIDTYYHSQIQRLEQEVEWSENTKSTLSLRIKELEENQQIINSKIQYYQGENQELRRENQELRENKSKLQNEMEIIQFSSNRDKCDLEWKIKELDEVNGRYVRDIKELESVIGCLEQKLVSQQQLSSSYSKGLLESFGYNRRSSTIMESYNLGNEIREAMGKEEGGGTPGTSGQIRKWSATLDKYINNPKLQVEGESDEMNKLIIDGRMLRFRSRTVSQKQQSQEQNEEDQTVRFRVNYLSRSRSTQGFLNIGLEMMVFQDNAHSALKIVGVEMVRKIEVYGNLLGIRVGNMDYLVQSRKVMEIVRVLGRRSKVPVSVMDLCNKAFLTNNNTLVSINQFLGCVLNPHMISFRNNVRWVGTITEIKRNLFRNSSTIQFGVLRDQYLLLFSDSSMRRVTGYIPIGVSTVSVCDEIIKIEYSGWKEGYCLQVESREDRVELCRQIEKMRKEVQSWREQIGDTIL